MSETNPRNELYAQIPYWDRVAPCKTFSHPFDFDLFARFVGPDAAILDLGCGYGRLTAELASRGYSAVLGADSSAGMIARGQHEHPELDLRVLSPRKLPFADATFEAVLLFAVLTCIPRDEDLFALIAEISRVLRPCGVLYLSDYCLQPDARNVQRYRENESRFGTYGIFVLPEGAVVRHFDPRWLDQHLTEYAVLDRREVEIATMNGNPGRATQMLLRKTHP